jgi:hypothetical protein
LEADDIIEDNEVLAILAEDKLKLRELRTKNNHLQKPKGILAAKQQRTNMQAKVKQMILEEEQKARELEQQIIEMQGEDPCHQQQAPVLNLNPRHPQIPAFAPATFQGLNYLDEQSPLAPQLQVSPWPQNYRACTYPKYKDSTNPTRYIMSYQVTITSSQGVTPPWPSHSS